MCYLFQKKHDNGTAATGRPAGILLLVCALGMGAPSAHCSLQSARYVRVRNGHAIPHHTTQLCPSVVTNGESAGGPCPKIPPTPF